MDSSSKINQSLNSSLILPPLNFCYLGYSTPPRTKKPFEPKPCFSQPKLLTSSELKRRFSPIYASNKKHRHHDIRKFDSLAPFEHHRHLPLILHKLFTADSNKENLLSIHEDDSIVPSKASFHPPIFDTFISNSNEPTFAISETIMKEKLQILLEKK
jgi:hypothetical protein